MTNYIKHLERVENDWCHNWCLSDAKLHDYVKGPLISPMLTVPVPYTINQKDMGECNCGKRLKEYYSKCGIPDPWDEYLIIRREGEENNDILNKFPKIDLDITKSLARNYRVYLGQGIPDPWKYWTVAETAEPNPNNYRKNFQRCGDNFKIGPEREICDADKICCPNCKTNLIVLWFTRTKKKDGDKNKEVETAVEETLPAPGSESATEGTAKEVREQLLVTQPEATVENIRVEAVIKKDASVETDWIREEREKKFATKICKCKTDGICSRCESGKRCFFCPVCNWKKSEKALRKYKNYICCTCLKKLKEKKDNIKPRYYFDIGSIYPFGLPLKCEFFGQNGPWMAQSLPYFGCPPETNYIHQGSTNPFLRNNWTWFPQQFVGLREKNHHGLELQLVCPKCEKKRKNGRKERSDDYDVNHKEFLPCHCEKKIKRRNWDGFVCLCPYKRAIQKEGDHGIIGEEKTSFLKPKSRKPEDEDYLNMLETFGLKDHFRKIYEITERANSDNIRPSLSTFLKSDLSSLRTSLEKPYQEAASDLDKSPLRRHKLSHNEPKRIKKSTFNNTSKDINANSKESDFPRTNYKPQFSISELWKVKRNTRTPRHTGFRKKDLYKHKTKFGKNSTSDDSDTSLGARTRRN